MGKKSSSRRQRRIRVVTQTLPRSPGYPFYERLNQVLEKAGFDAFVEGLCARVYADGIGRPSLRPGRYFRTLLVGYFEGLNSERAIAWRVADSMSLCPLLDLDPEETLRRAQEEVTAVRSGAEAREVVADKGYDSNETVLELKELGLWGICRKRIGAGGIGKGITRNTKRRSMPIGGGFRGRRGQLLQRRTSELVERPFAHQFGTGGLRRIFVRGHANVRKRLLIHVCGFNLDLLVLHLTGDGTPPSLQDRVLTRLFTLFGAIMGHWIGWNRLWKRFRAPIGLDSLFGTSQTHH